MQAETKTSTPPAQRIVPRDLRFHFDADLARHWLGGDGLATHIGNGFHLVFPAAERFVIKSVRHHADRLRSAALRAEVRDFVRQEAHHAREHERFLRTLETQGFELGPYLALQLRVFQALERLSPQLAIATTAAAEHYTATLGEFILKVRPFEDVPPALRDLLMWHAAEEIEHRSVAFDVLREVDGAYGLRVAGLAVATATIFGLWTAATLTLLHQDDAVSWLAVARRLRTSGVPLPLGPFARSLLAWLRPGFEPAPEGETDRLAGAYLGRLAGAST